MAKAVKKSPTPTRRPPVKQKPPKTSNALWYWIVAVAALVLAMLYFFLAGEKASKGRKGKLRAFGIDMPAGYEIHGVDLSYFQEEVNWAAIKSAKDNGVKIGFVYIKATEGITRQDKKFAYNWQMAKTARIPRGAYHYFISSRSGKDQAANFIRTVHLSPGDLPPVLDIERIRHTSHAEMRAEVKDWLDMVEDAYGVKPVIYTFTSFYNDYLGRDFDRYPLWIAHYQNLDLPRISRSWQLWQYSEEGKIKGLRGHFDFNVFNGDSTDFDNMKMK